MGASRGMDEQQSQPPLPSSLPPPSSSGGGAKRDEAAGPVPKAGPSNFLGKHRLAAAISHLHQQIDIIQEELEKLETLGESSIVCKELISSVESVPDPMLPMIKGPAEIGWERWFKGAHSSRSSRKRWI